METQKPPLKLLVHADGVLPQPVQPHLIACCPTMDLIAFVNQDEQLNVYRFGGQRAFGLQKRNGTGNIVSLGWKFNGQYIAVGWSTGAVDVVSVETGAVLQHFRQPSLLGQSNEGSNPSGITCIGWGLNFIDARSVRRKTDLNGSHGPASSNPFDGRTTDDWNEAKETASLDDFLERITDADKIDIPLDLPEQLARLDITSSMVKPPALPLLPPTAYKTSDHPAAELFSSRVSLDAAICANSSHSINALETLLLAQDNGQVRLILYDTLSIGEVMLPAEWKLSNVKFRHCASHPFSSTYMFLVDFSSEAGKPKTALVPLSLRFLHSSGSQLYIIESKTAQLEVMVQYVGEVLNGIHYHWKHAKELPAKFMDNINEELVEKNEPSLMQSLFHLAATGDCPPTLKEWLVDILAERGHKRWDHSIMHGYTKVRELAHECLLPALDRCVAILCHLRGLAIYHEHSPIFNVPSAIFDSILNIIRCMRLLAHHVLLFCSEETQQFTTFSRWLRREIDVQAAQTPPNPNEEAEQDLNIDYSLLLSYIQGPLEKSKLDLFVTREQDPPTVPASASMYEEMKGALESFKDGEGTKEELINLNGYIHQWTRQHTTLVAQITNHQRASTIFASGIVLEEGDVLVSDMCMVQKVQPQDSPKLDENLITTITAVVHKDKPNRVSICHVTHESDVESTRSVKEAASTAIGLPPTYRIQDVKFVANGNLLVLAEDIESYHLLAIPTISTEISMKLDTRHNIEQLQHVVPSGQPLQSGKSLDEISPTLLQQYIKHTFEPGDQLKPAKIEVNGRKNRRFVVVLGEDCRQMRILDLDFRAGDEKAGRAEQGAKDDGDDEMVDS